MDPEVHHCSISVGISKYKAWDNLQHAWSLGLF